MILSDKTARQIYAEMRAAPPPRFRPGRRAALVAVDMQRRYTDKATFATAYETDPQQIAHVNAIARACRARGLPVVWTYVAYEPSGRDCGLWGVRNPGPSGLQNVKHGSPMAEIDARCERDADDVLLHKRMGSAFFETHLASLLTFERIDTVIVTGGATSGCVRCTVVDAMSHGLRVIVPEECVADRHESAHFASLYDMATKYADVLPVADVLAHLDTMIMEGARDAG